MSTLAIKRTHCFLFALILLRCESGFANEELPTIEVFTDSAAMTAPRSAAITVYLIDRISRLQKTLSEDLPSDPQLAKQSVMHRVQNMDQSFSREMENAASGLFKAMNYGIDRYPAIVFDGRAVVYGITDIQAATQWYRQWQSGAPRS